jgi:hypothetical protein
MLLRAQATDSAATSAQRDFNIVINDRPRITTTIPSTSNTMKMNCAVNKNFEIQIEDLNHSNPGQAFTVNWFLNGLPHASLGATTDTATYPMNSVATFSPACNLALLGDHIITVVVSDGFESATVNWNVKC